MKRYVIIAGVNGAGKSSLYNSIIGYEELQKINADDIARELGHWSDKRVQAQAGMIAVRQIREYFDQGISQETTLTGKSIFNNIQRAKEKGYIIELHYIGLENVGIAKERVKNRVEHGGHGVSEQDIERRYVESMHNLKTVIPQCDIVWIYDNTVEFKTIAYYGKENRVTFARCAWFKRCI